jgi:cytochrome b
MKVWDPLVRIVHWAVAVGIAVSWWTSERSETWHIRFGYAVATMVLIRLAWGFIGSRHARFADFVRGWAATTGYAHRVLQRTEGRHLGHNPLGGWMALALWAAILGTCFTGWLYTTDAYFGIAWVELTHVILAWTVVALLPLHIAGVIFTSLRYRENLVIAMITGRKRPGA